jgi:prefoldin subunit 5
VSRLSNLSIQQKIVGLSAFFLVTLALTSLVAGITTKSLGHAIQSTADHKVQPALLATNADRDMYQAQIALEQLPVAAYNGDADALKDAKETWEENVGQVMERFELFKTHAESVADSENQADWAVFETDYAAWKAAGDATVAAAMNQADGPMAAAGATTAALTQEQPTFTAARDHLDAYQDVFSQESITAAADELDADATRSEWFILVMVLISFGLGLPVSLWVGKTVASFVSTSARRLSDASSGLAALSSQLGTNSRVTVEEAMTVSSASEVVADNVQTVAAAIEEMEASIREIASNAGEANRIAAEGVTIAAQTNEQVARLGVSGQEIGKVLDVITSIAEQTNLLALNATIEAARAGEAGKGFAVVANEVKELAKETANATDIIAQRIATIQADTTEAAASIAGISSTIDQINGIQASIAGAVEEQTATTSEIARSIAQASEGVQDITSRIRTVANQAQESSEGAARTEGAAGELMQIADALGSDKSERAQRPQVSARDRFMGARGVDTPSDTYTNA